MSPGSLSFAKLVMMSSAPTKSGEMPDTRPKIHSFNKRCLVQSQFQSVLGVRSFHVEHKKVRIVTCKVVITRTIFNQNFNTIQRAGKLLTQHSTAATCSKVLKIDKSFQCVATTISSS